MRRPKTTKGKAEASLRGWLTAHGKAPESHRSGRSRALATSASRKRRPEIHIRGFEKMPPIAQSTLLEMARIVCQAVLEGRFSEPSRTRKSANGQTQVPR